MNAPTELIATETSSLQLAVAAPRMPISVMLVWMCAFAGLVLYTASWYVPGLAELAR